MTTQHTHHDNSDVEVSVVVSPSVSEYQASDDFVVSQATAASSEPVDADISSSSASVEDLSQETPAEVMSVSLSEESVQVASPALSPSDSDDQFDASQSEKEHEDPLLATSSVDVTATAVVPVSDDPVSEISAADEPSADLTAAPAMSPASDNEVVSPAEDVPASVEVLDASAVPLSVPEQEVPLAAALEEVSLASAEVTASDSQDSASTLPADPVESALPQTPVSQDTKDASPSEQDPAFAYAEDPVLDDTRAEEVRPFTDFIAEFRQAEAAFQATLRDTQIETLSILSSVTTDLVQSDQKPEEVSVAPTAELLEVKPLQEEAESLQEVSDLPAQASTDVAETEAQKEHDLIDKKEETRPVSPLLRPASRIRLPRHGLGRHQREEIPTETVLEQKSATRPEPQATVPGSVAEVASEVVPERRARRYRFDDRPTANHANGNGLARVRTTTSLPSPSPVVSNQSIPQPQVEEERPTPLLRVPTAPLPAPVVPEPAPEPVKPVAQEEVASQPAPVEHTRRRHSQKEHTAAANVVPAQPVAPVVEPVLPVEDATQPEEVAPEDLPPLEYSELQKASSRRRRRHRSASSTASQVAPATNGANGQLPIPAPIMPPTAVPAPLPSPNTGLVAHQQELAGDVTQQYTIVSGYTVSQMNQGNDGSGPFMGPDPSPARGSVFVREGRATRAETRTTSAPAPVYPPARPSEGGISAAAMTQFANVVSQALQTQTDRMVAEFRRISQAPTNVSVTLPPFPSTERVGVFVDVANLLYSARTLRMGVDFGKLLDFLRGNRRLVRAHAYCPTSPQPSDEQMFLQAVKGLGYRITTKNYKTFSSGAKKADLDLDLCMDVVRLVDGNAVDCVVLVSGDSDFMPMLDYCSDHGVRVEVAAFDEAMSATLRQSCDLFINLSMLDEIRV